MPLVLGLGIYGLWFVTRWDGLVSAGLLTIVGGTVSLGAGVICLIAYGFRIYAKGVPTSVVVRRVSLPAGLLLTTPLVGMLVASSALHALTTYEVVLYNASDTTITTFSFTAPGVDETWANVEPGAFRLSNLSVTGDGTLLYEAAVGTERALRITGAG